MFCRPGHCDNCHLIRYSQQPGCRRRVFLISALFVWGWRGADLMKLGSRLQQGPGGSCYTLPRLPCQGQLLVCAGSEGQACGRAGNEERGLLHPPKSTHPAGGGKPSHYVHFNPAQADRRLISRAQKVRQLIPGFSFPISTSLTQPPSICIFRLPPELPPLPQEPSRDGL